MTDTLDNPTDASTLGPRAVTLLGMAVNVVLAVGKVLTGVVFGSQTILADGVHSASDLITDIAVLAGLGVSSKPADPDHHYGHRRVATLVALFVGGALVAAAVGIAADALDTFRKLLTLQQVEAIRPLWPLVAACVSVPAKEIIFRLTRRVARRVDDASLEANAWHHRTDALSSIAAATGIAAVWIGGETWRFLDPLGAVVLSAFLVSVGVRVLWRSASELTDRAPREEVIVDIEQIVADTDGVRNHHAVRARTLGGRLEMDVHVQVDADLTVYDGHNIATQVRRRIRDAHPRVQEVIVHVEPADTGDQADY
ncbi:MAG: cation diffusion facilitator family transporter [Planctomycetes bacterium]|jgi:cation diffusion facilitator family transporter|nr:cation diffusion facilitator family transporter [Planctomycetota bacterium]